MFDWLLERYPKIQRHHDLCNFDQVLEDLKGATKQKEIMGLEGIVARHYWDALCEIFPDKFDFDKRTVGRTTRPLGAVDPINSLFNYGYSILESYCRKAINGANLDPCLGFLHETRQTKEAFVYDFQEPFRWLVDLTVIQALENKLFHKNDFIRTEDYVMRLRPKGVKKLVEELDRSFSQSEKYNGKQLQWSTVIQVKGQEFSSFLTSKRKCIDFSKPEPKLERVDSQDLRKKILDLSYTQWKEMGMNRTTLWYLKKSAEGNNPFTLNNHVRERVEGMM